MADQVNSICAIYAMLIEHQLRSSDPDMGKVYDNLERIKENCQSVSNQPGETPDHLEDFLFEDGEGAGETGTVVVDGKKMPKSAAEKLDG